MKMSIGMLKRTALTLIIAVAWPLFAAQRTWTGASATSGNWTTAANWDNNIAPVAGDVLVFSGVAARRSNTNNFPSYTVFYGIGVAGSYNIYGNAVTLTNLLSLVGSGVSLTFRPDIRIGGFHLEIICAESTDLMTLAGDIDLNDHALLINAVGDVTMSGAISGEGDIYKYDPGELLLSGSTDNTFDGFLSVVEGILRLNKFATIGPVTIARTAIPGNLNIGVVTNGPINDMVVLERSHQIANTSRVRISSSGRFDLNGHDETIGKLVPEGGLVVTADGTNVGTLTLEDTVFAVGTDQSRIVGQLDLGSGTERVFDIAAGAQLLITASISGGGNTTLLKTNSGELWLNAPNTYGGATFVNGGTLTVSHPDALGAATNGTFLRGRQIGGTLKFYGPVSISGETLVTESNALINVQNGNSSWNGPIVLNSDATISIETNLMLSLNGPISGARNLNSSGRGIMRLAGLSTNTFAGSAVVDRGELQLTKLLGNAVHRRVAIGNGFDGPDEAIVRLNNSHQINDTGRIVIAQSGLLHLNAQTEMIGSLEGVGRVDLANGGTLVVGGLNLSTNFMGRITGSGNFEKTGPATLTLSSNHTFTGECRVSGGTLLVDGSIQPSSMVIVSNGGTLGGRGFSPEILVSPGGILNPGTASPGVLASTGSVTFASNSVFRVRINGATPGTGYDQLLNIGALQLGGCTLDVSFGFTPALSNSFKIIDNFLGNPVQGTFAGLPQGAVFAIGNLLFQIDYAGGNGNDVVIKPVISVSFDSITITGGNGNGIVDVNECNLINVVLTNTTGSVLSNVTGTLVLKTPGVSVTHGTSGYPVFPINSRRTNSLPFQFTTSPTFVCGGNIQFDLVVSTPTNGSFSLPIVIGPAGCGNGGGGCESCPERTISGFLGTNSPVQLDRLNRDGVMHVCDEVRACPGLAGEIEARYFDAYTFENGESDACITVTLTSGSDELFSAAYTNFYNPSNACQNYLTDAGTNSTLGVARSYSFNAGPHARFVIVVHADLSGDGGPYTLAVTGGSCRPVLKIERITGNQVALDWSTATVGYGLQQTNRLPPVANPIWAPSTPLPAIVNSRFRVTNTINASNLFYELRKP